MRSKLSKVAPNLEKLGPHIHLFAPNLDLFSTNKEQIASKLRSKYAPNNEHFVQHKEQMLLAMSKMLLIWVNPKYNLLPMCLPFAHNLGLIAAHLELLTANYDQIAPNLEQNCSIAPHLELFGVLLLVVGFKW